MPRPRKPRFVREEPGTRYFKPQGIPLRELESVVLSVEELEALRLVDGEGLYQEAAAQQMEVSRQTFQRILRGARKKVADALANGKALGIDGGDYVLTGGPRMFECVDCGLTWEVPFGSGGRARDALCARCGGQVVRAAGGHGFGARRGVGHRGRFGPPGAAGQVRNENGGGVQDE